MAREPLTPFLQPGTDPDIAAAYATLAERARTAVFGFEDEVAFIDVETTGFDPASDEVIEVAAVIARGPEIVDRWSSLVRPRGTLPLEITQLTGIDDAMLVDAPCMAEAGAGLSRFVGSRTVVAHNAPFDRAFLEHPSSGGCRLAGPWIDSLEVVRIALPRLRSAPAAHLSRASLSMPAGGTAHLTTRRHSSVCGASPSPH